MTKSKAGLSLHEQQRVHIEIGMHGVSKIFIENATMQDMEYIRDVMEMPNPVDHMGHTEGIPDACKPLIRSSNTDDKQLLYGIPDPDENNGLIRVVKFYASMKEAERFATSKLELLLGPDGKYYAEEITKSVEEGEKYREEFMRKLEADYEKRTGKKL